MGLSNRLLRFAMTMNQRTELWVKNFILTYKSKKPKSAQVISALSALLPFVLSVVSSEHDTMSTVTSKEKDIHS